MNVMMIYGWKIPFKIIYFISVRKVRKIYVCLILALIAYGQKFEYTYIHSKK